MYFKDQNGSLHFLSDEDIANGGMGFLPVGSVKISDDEAGAILNPPKSLPQMLGEKLAVLNARATALLADLSVSYPDGEVQSWGQQTREAEALALNPSAPAPLLTTIAAARGLPLAELAARVREKVQAYAVASGHIIGQRQALEDAIHAVDLAASDAAAQLEMIKWPA